jgi:hypothetical protein
LNRKAALLVLPFNASSVNRSSMASKSNLPHSSTLADVNFAIEKVAQDCRFILRALRPSPRGQEGISLREGLPAPDRGIDIKWVELEAIAALP